MASAAQIAARKKFSDIMKSGGFKKNPLTRVKKNSPSMATGKAPSTRLKKRRAKTAKAPAGYYANPAKWLGQLYTVFHRGTSNVAVEQIQANTPSQATKMAAEMLGMASNAYLVARKINPTILITDTPKKRTVIRRVNPVAKTMSVSKKSAPPIKFPFIVEYNNSGEGKFNVFAGFKYKEDAFAAAKTFAKEFSYLFIRVMSYKNGAM
jgi:hypothetical protein